jgi:hypothetical protein
VDLNYLLERRQVSLIMAERATSEEARRAHRALADGYTARIAAAEYPATARKTASCER